MGFYTTDAAVYCSMAEQVGHPEGGQAVPIESLPPFTITRSAKAPADVVDPISPNRAAVRSAGQLRSVAR